MHPDLVPNRLLAAYAVGIFPMADETGELRWLAPDPRAIIELDGFKTTRSLRAVVRRGVYTVSVDRAFRDVIKACADRPEGTWISQEVLEAYCELHRLGFAHSVEAWKADALAGGLYGVSIGGAFFGESMFHLLADASKVATVHLVEHMVSRGFELLDVQFLTDHLLRFGATEIPRTQYERRLADAIRLDRSFVDRPDDDSEERPRSGHEPRDD